mgnify:CR=1 FL=1|jgi:hypothetical protein
MATGRQLPWPGRPEPRGGEFFVCRRELSAYHRGACVAATFDRGLFLDGVKTPYRELSVTPCRHNINELTSPLWRLTVVHARQIGEMVMRFTVDVFVDLPHLLALQASGQHVCGRSILLHHALSVYGGGNKNNETHVDQFILERLFPVGRLVEMGKDAEALLKTPPPPPPPPPLPECRLQTKLFAFQEASFARMMRMECEPRRVSYVPSTHVRIGEGESSLYITPELDLLGGSERPPSMARVRGGILSDKMGMGKTLTVIGVCQSRPIRGDAAQMRPKSTLVLCPAHVIHHWAREIAKHSGASSVTIATKDDMKRVTVGSVLSDEYDYVIVSFNLFSNGYLREPVDYYYYHGRTAPNCHGGVGQRVGNFKNDFARRPAAERAEHRFHPCLFRWGRVVVDEFHELGNAVHSQALMYTSSLESDFTWLVSGTPAVNAATTCRSLICKLLAPAPDMAAYDGSMSVLHHCIVTNATYDGVRIPDLVETVRWIDFSPHERQLYDALAHEGRAHQLRVCSYPRLAHIASVDMKQVETVEEMREHAVRHLRCRIKETAKTIAAREKVLSDLPPADGGTSRVNQLRRESANDLISLRAAMDSLVRTEAYVANSSSDTCAVCLDPIDDPAMLRRCGHTLCRTCCRAVLARDARCPTCREPARERDVITLAAGGRGTADGDMGEMLQRYGSKLAHLIAYLRGSGGVKTLVFSQWDELLRDIGKCIQEFDNVLYCRGNVNSKNASIRKFNASPGHNLLLLSTLNCGSGCDLTGASRVILLDALDGDHGVVEIERQAIARCHRIGQTRNVEVVRFLMKDSIEEQIYNDATRRPPGAPSPSSSTS